MKISFEALRVKKGLPFLFGNLLLSYNLVLAGTGLGDNPTFAQRL